MERPKTLTPEMTMAVAAKVADALIRDGLYDASEKQEIACDIAKVGRYFMDGYALAKALEDRCCWDCDLQTAEALDGFSFHAHQEIEAAQKVWAAAHMPDPPLPVGTRVRCPGGETGIIDGIYEHGPASYAIKVDGDERADGPHRVRRIVFFEDVEVLS